MATRITELIRIEGRNQNFKINFDQPKRLRSLEIVIKQAGYNIISNSHIILYTEGERISEIIPIEHDGLKASLISYIYPKYRNLIINNIEIQYSDFYGQNYYKMIIAEQGINYELLSRACTFQNRIINVFEFNPILSSGLVINIHTPRNINEYGFQLWYKITSERWPTPHESWRRFLFGVENENLAVLKHDHLKFESSTLGFGLFSDRYLPGQVRITAMESF